MLAGDTQGFPNGRRLTDDVTDIELRVVGGFLKGNKLPLGDGVDQNDVPFRIDVPVRRGAACRVRLAAEAHRADPRADADPEARPEDRWRQPRPARRPPATFARRAA